MNSMRTPVQGLVPVTVSAAVFNPPFNGLYASAGTTVTYADRDGATQTAAIAANGILATTISAVTAATGSPNLIGLRLTDGTTGEWLDFDLTTLESTYTDPSPDVTLKWLDSSPNPHGLDPENLNIQRNIKEGFRSLNVLHPFANYPFTELTSSDLSLPRIHCDPVNGNDAWDGSTKLLSDWVSSPKKGPKRNLSTTLAGLTTATMIVVPDRAVFSYSPPPLYVPSSGNPVATARGKGWAGQVPTADVIVINESALMGIDDPGLGWVSSSEVGPAYDTANNRFKQWTIVAGTVWTLEIDPGSPSFSWPTSQTGGVWDENVLDTEGQPTRYRSVVEADVSTTPFSYFYSSSVFKINTNSSNLVSTEGIRLFANVQNGRASLPSSGTRTVKIVNGTFEGGSIPFYADPTKSETSGTITQRLKLTLWGCRFTRSAGRKGGVHLETCVDVRAFYCRSWLNGNDGFRYYGSFKYDTTNAIYRYGADRLITFIEVGCDSSYNGYQAFIAQDGSGGEYGKCNGFTIHQGTRGIRVAPVAYKNGGPNIGDACTSGSGDSLNLSPLPFNSDGVAGTSDYQTDLLVAGQSKTPDLTTIPGEWRGMRCWVIDADYTGNLANSYSDILAYLQTNGSSSYWQDRPVLLADTTAIPPSGRRNPSTSTDFNKYFALVPISP